MQARIRAVAGRWHVVAGALWLARYATLGNMPFWRAPLWAGWFDQSRYLASALALSRGDLSAGAHWYPLGYPLAAAPFAWAMPGDSFFLLDLVLFLLTCGAFRAVAGRLGIGGWPATWCFLATTLVQTGIAGTWAHPWTTTLSAALLWWLVAHVAAIGDGGSPRRQTIRLAAIGALAAALPLVRPVDALPAGCALAIAGVSLLRRRDLSFRAIGVAVAAAGIAGIPVGGAYAGLHLAIYGPHPTAYMVAASRTGFIWSDLGFKAHVLLVNPRPWYPDGRAVLETLPWIVPGAAGLVALAAIGTRRERGVVCLLLGTMLPVSVVMLAYADLQPPGLWYNGNVHYFKWTLPAFGCGVLLCRRLLWTVSGRRTLAAVLVMLMVPIGIRIDPVPVEARTPARMLLYRGDTRRAWQEAYFSPVVIVDDTGPLRNVSDFHQLPDAGGERAIAISRPFDDHPRRTDPGERMSGANQLPYARYGAKMSYLWF